MDYIPHRIKSNFLEGKVQISWFGITQNIGKICYKQVCICTNDNRIEREGIKVDQQFNDALAPVENLYQANTQYSKNLFQYTLEDLIFGKHTNTMPSTKHQYEEMEYCWDHIKIT